jgi:hypothetical protein
MGKTKGPYNAEFPAGSTVRIVDRSALEAFRVKWKWHHPLSVDQLTYAGRMTRIKSVGYYHGGDELYWLEEIPGTWHEENLESAPEQPDV